VRPAPALNEPAVRRDLVGTVDRDVEPLERVEGLHVETELARGELGLERRSNAADGDPPARERRPAPGYAVASMQEHHTGLKTKPETFGEKPYYKPKRAGMKLVEVRYPKSWADLKIDASIWDNDDETQEEFQKRLLAGIYDGVTSAARYLSGVGVDNNVELAMGRMSPKAFDTRIGLAIDKKIASLKRQRDVYTTALSSPSSPEGQAYSGISAVELTNRQITIDNEIKKLEARKAAALGVEITKQQAWVERSNFIHQVLAGLEDPERRLTIARLSERFKKYANAWGNPGFMVTKPDITGDKAVDDAIYLIWEGITLLSSGRVPGPVPVSGGPAAEAQAALTKSMYATLTYEELVGIRRLLSGEAQYKTQSKAVADLDGAKAEISKRIALIEGNATRIQKWAAINDAKDALMASQYGAWLSSVAKPTPL